MDAEERAEREVAARVAVLAGDRGLAGRDHRAAGADESLDAGDLGVAEAAHVGEDDDVQSLEGLCDLVGVQRHVGDAGAVQRLHRAAIGRHRLVGGVGAAEVVVVLLGPDHADVGAELAVNEQVLVLFVPGEDRLGGRVLPPVLVHRADVVPPGLDAAGEARGRPEPHLGLRHAGEAEGGGAELVLRHRLGDQLVPARDLVQPLAGLGVLLEAVVGVAPLVVEHDDRRLGEDALEVDEAVRVVEELAADHPQPGAVLAAGLAGDLVVKLPEVGPALEVPAHPVAVGVGVPVVRPRQLLAGVGLELRLAMVAVADAGSRQARPAVVGEAVRMAALDDLAHHVRQELAVVGRADAGDELVGLADRLAVDVAADPVGVRFVEVPGDSVRSPCGPAPPAPPRGRPRRSRRRGRARRASRRGGAAGSATDNRRRCRRR